MVYRGQVLIVGRLAFVLLLLMMSLGIVAAQKAAVSEETS